MATRTPLWTGERTCSVPSLKMSPQAEEGVGEADANNRRRRAAKGRAKEEREERAELAPFGEDYGSGGLNRAEIDLFDDDGL